MTPSEPASRVFLSHSHHDNALCERLVTSLVAAGLDVWYDEQNLSPGHLAPTVERELRSRDTLLVVLSPAALTSQWVQSEWYAGWELLGEGKIQRLVPILAEPCDVPLLLRGMRWVYCVHHPFDKAQAQLLKILGVAGETAAIHPPDQWGLVMTIRAHPVRGCFSLAWSPDGRFLASGSYDRTVRVWDVATWQSVATFTGHTNGIDAVAWSPDGGTIASASLGSTIRLWDITTGQPGATLSGHQNGVADVAWSPDGLTLVSGSADHTVRVWEVASARCLLVLSGHTAPVTSVAWSPDGRWIGSTARDATFASGIPGRGARPPSLPATIRSSIVCAGRPMGVSSHPRATRRFACGIQRMARSGHCSPGTRATSCVSRGGPMAPSWPPARPTTPFAYGMRRRASRSSRLRAIAIGYTRSPGRPTARHSRRAAACMTA